MFQSIILLKQNYSRFFLVTFSRESSEPLPFLCWMFLELDINCCITNSQASVENSRFTCTSQLTFLCHVRYRYYPFYYLKLLSRTTTCFFFLEIKAELEYICWLSKPGETGHFNTGQDGNSPCSSSSYYNKILCFTLIPSRPRKNSVQTRKLARSDLNKSLKE